MFNKNDPLIDSVTKVMQENQARRDAVNAVNEAFGITDKRHLPFQVHAEYDALVEEMTKEALVGNQHKLDVNKNNRLDKHDFKMLRGMKKKPMEEGSALSSMPKTAAGGSSVAGSKAQSAIGSKPMEEGKMKDIATDKAEKERLAQMKKMEEQQVNTAAKGDSMAPTATAPQSTVTLKPLKKAGLPTLGGMTVARKNMEEEALDEISKKMAGKYTKAAANDLADKTDPNYGFMTDKDEDQVERETENRRKGIQRAVKTMMKEKAIKEERGKKVASAILAKMRAKAGKIDEFITMPNNKPDPLTSFRQRQVDQTGAAIKKYTDTIQDPAKKAATQTFVGGAQKAAEPVLKKQGLQPAPTSLAPKLPVRPGQQNSGPAKPDTSMGAGRAAERNVVSPPKTTTPLPPPKPGATGRTIQGPAGTTATMTGRGNDAIVKTKSGTFAGSVVKGLGGGAKIQNFRAGGGTPMGPKGK